MSPAATSGQPLQHFIHYDFDALRMEIAGSLSGPAAQKAYEAWQTARLLARQLPPVIDISYVTEVDEEGRAVLQAWRGQGARIVASSFSSRAIGGSILSGRAGNSARAEDANTPSARARQMGLRMLDFRSATNLARQVR
jgi:hypothetical protein